MTPYPIQQKAIDAALDDLATKVPAHLHVFPTGTGKTFMQFQVLKQAKEQLGLRGLQIVESLEIGLGFAKLFGIPIEPGVRGPLADNDVFTSRKFFNLLSAGKIDPTQYDFIQLDEAHHSTNKTHKTIDSYMGYKPRFGWTATDYRGSPQETKGLYDWWGGNVTRWITEVDAVKEGYASAPVVSLVPLVNDELISVINGEFSADSIEGETKDIVRVLVEDTIQWYYDRNTKLWDRPTMLTLTTKGLIEEAMLWLSQFDLPAVAVTSDSGYRRIESFRAVVEREAILVQINVVGEGVDLPLRRLIDAAPTMSPLRWRQRIGRIMRPTKPEEKPPEYIVTNHNLLRHGYLLNGVLPPSYIKTAISAWGPAFKPSHRMVSRVVGMTGLGRFVPNRIPLADGGFVWFFVLATPDGKKQYSAIVNPLHDKTVYAVREFEMEVRDGIAYKRYDKQPSWRRIKSLPDMTGCTSVPAPALTPGMRRFWANAAAFKGLDVTSDVNARQFQVLPLLQDIGGKFRENGELR